MRWFFTSANLISLLFFNQAGTTNAFNLYKIWLVVVLVMAISAFGYIALRSLGARFGLPIAGLASGGFISSTATIGAMGACGTIAAYSPGGHRGNALSTVATFVQMIAVVGTA